MIQSLHEGAAFAFIYTFFIATTIAAPIIVVNPSFERDKVKMPTASPSAGKFNAPSGWSHYGDGDSGATVLADSMYPVSVNGLDGKQVYSWQGGTGSGGIRQTLNVRLLANTTYTLSLSSGTRPPGSPPFSGYRVELSTISGIPILSWDGAGYNPALPGQFATISRSVTTGAQPRGLNDALQISISRPPNHNNGYLDIDNVQLTATTAPASRTGTDIDVFLIAGQSNAYGWGVNASRLSALNRHYADAPAPNALLAYMQKDRSQPLYNIGSIALLSTQGAGFPGNCDGFGPELSAGKDLAAASPDRPIALLKFTVGSAGLIRDLRKEAADPNPANHFYGPMLEFFQRSLQDLRDKGFTPQVRALFWLQGESDSGDARSAMGYPKAIVKFISDLQEDVPAPKMKAFLTGINGHTVALAARADVIAIFNQGLNDIASSETGIHYVSIDDITTGFADNIHYSADQTIDIGQRWARAYLAAQKEKP